MTGLTGISRKPNTKQFIYMAKIYSTPGVYIEEKGAFPNSVVAVATAVPAFIGYTEKASLDTKDVTNKPTRISSFGEYLLYFGGAPNTTFDSRHQRWSWL